MSELFAKTIPLALGAIVSPTLLTAVLLVLTGKVSPRSRSWAFVAGGCTALAAFTVAIPWVAELMKSVSAVAIQRVDVLLGVLLLAVALSALSLVAATGLRSGEARALKWDDVDFKAGTMRVRGTLSRIDHELVVTEPKTAKSRRTLPLSPAVAAILKEHRREQRRERMHAGSAWTEGGYVFTTESGLPVDASNLRRALNVAADDKHADIADICVHTLRHSAATAWLEAGINLKAVSELLGHADIRVTADCYGHVTEATSRAAMDSLSDALGL